MLKWNKIQHSAYQSERFDLLTLLEGSTRLPYVDGVGDPTIGIGFNLVYNLKPVLRVIVGSDHWSNKLYGKIADEIARSYDSGDDGSLIANLDRVMAKWHDTRDSAVPDSFAFKNDAQIERALNKLAPKYDGYIDGWLSDIPESSERSALFSLAWNAPGLLGPKLKAAIETGDRAEAWYEIRYNSLSSSLPDSLKQAIANRRYVEADEFSLYDRDGRSSYAQAIQAGEMFAAHHQTVLAYEKAYDPLTAADVKGVETIDTITAEMQPAIKAVIGKYDLPSDLKIETLMAAGADQSDLSGEGSGYDTPANDADLLVGDNSANEVDGGKGHDVLIGLKGADILTGGKGADLFVFTRAQDSPSAGKADVITDFDPGHDRIIIRPGGEDFNVLDDGEAFGGDHAEIRWYDKGQKTMIEADFDGDGHADLVVKLKGQPDLSADDFLL